MYPETDIRIVAASWPIWACAVAGVSIVLGQAFSYLRLGISHAPLTGLSRKDCFKAFRIGFFASIAPSIASVLIIMSMTAVIGAPFSWLRLSVIGAAHAEMAAAQAGASAMGVALGGPGFGIREMAVAWFAMTINGGGWLIVSYFLLHRMKQLQACFGTLDSAELPLMAVAACMGLMLCYFSAYLKVIDARTISALVSGVCMLLLHIPARRFEALRSYSLGISIISGLLAGWLSHRFL